MGTATADRLWAIGGGIVAVIVVLVGWFMFISPQNAETANLRNEIAATGSQVSTLQARLSQLSRENADLPRYEADLARDRQALPTDSGLSDFLRELQVASANANVSVSGLTIGAPTQVVKTGSPVFGLPITVTAVGLPARLGRFLHELQQVQPRAVLISSSTLSGNGKKGLDGASSLTISMQVFVAQPSGQERPAQADGKPAPSPSATK
jgi:Tfp pilus assembly protein PilO